MKKSFMMAPIAMIPTSGCWSHLNRKRFKRGAEFHRGFIHACPMPDLRPRLRIAGTGAWPVGHRPTQGGDSHEKILPISRRRVPREHCSFDQHRPGPYGPAVRQGTPVIFGNVQVQSDRVHSWLLQKQKGAEMVQRPQVARRKVPQIGTGRATERGKDRRSAPVSCGTSGTIQPETYAQHPSAGVSAAFPPASPSCAALPDARLSRSSLPISDHGPQVRRFADRFRQRHRSRSARSCCALHCPRSGLAQSCCVARSLAGPSSKIKEPADRRIDLG